MQLLRASVAIEAIQTVLGFGIAAWLLLSHLARGGDATSILLLYWALRIPVLGDELALLVRQYPSTRNVMLRLLEPLLAPTSSASRRRAGVPAVDAPGGVDDRHGRRGGPGRRSPGVARRSTVAIPAGAHVAVVGASGAGKSTLVGLLLGWHTAAAGPVLVDGHPLDASRSSTCAG